MKTCSFALAFVMLASPGAVRAAEMEDWVDTQGDAFRAEAIDVLGPFALFLTAKGAGKRLALSLLRPEDCVRFHDRVSQRPARADRWVDATGEASGEVLTNVEVLDGERFFNPDFSTVPEPEYLLLFFGQYSKQRSFEAMRELIPEYQRVRERHGPLVEGVFLSVRHRASEHGNMVRDLHVPFLIEIFDRRHHMEALRQYAPPEGPMLMLMTRTGVPLAQSDCKSKADIERVCLELDAIVALSRPSNRRTWADRLYFYRNVRQAKFRTGRADPMLIGHVLDFDALRKAGISVVEASLQVAADGTVTAVDVLPTGGVTKETAPLLAAPLEKSAFVPAVQDGEFVDGVYSLRFEM